VEEDGGGEAEGVDAIHHTTVAGEEFAVVFDTAVTLDGGHHQAAEEAHDDDDGGHASGLERSEGCDFPEGGAKGGEVIAAVRIVDRTLEQHRLLIELMFSAPDSWLVEEAPPMAAPEHLGRVVRSLVQVFSRRRALQRLAPRFEVDLPVVVTRSDGRDISARAVDLSHAGMGVSVSSDEGLSDGTAATVTVSWNQYDQTTFQVQVVNARADRGHSILGLAFVDLDGLQNKDLTKHLYPDAVQAERKAA